MNRVWKRYVVTCDKIIRSAGRHVVGLWHVYLLTLKKSFFYAIALEIDILEMIGAVSPIKKVMFEMNYITLTSILPF